MELVALVPYSLVKYSITQGRAGGGGGGGRGRDEVWDRETMFSQLAKRSLSVVVSG